MPEPIETVVLKVDPDDPDLRAITAAAETLRSGGLVAFPTETVYGLGANALDAGAVAKIFHAKGRPASDPLIVHIASPDQLGSVAADVPSLARQLAREFWPGPLTLVLRRRPIVPANVSAGLDTVAVRMPSHPVALALLQSAALPIAAPSANLFSRTSPTTAEHVLQDLNGRIDMVLDGGPTPVGVESTVLDLTSDPPTVLRPGGVPAEALRHSIPSLQVKLRYVESEQSPVATASPGMLSKHYSPRAELLLLVGPPGAVVARMAETAERLAREGKRVGLMIADEERYDFASISAEIVTLGPRSDLAAIARNLFAGMRELDRQGVDVILAHGFGQEGLGSAIWDRLYRAAEGRVVDVQ